MKTLPIAINEEEFTELIKHTKKEHHKLAFLLGFGSGLRVSEVVNLHPREVILNEKKIFVRQGKGRKDRVVPVPKGFKTKHLDILPIKCGIRALQYAFRASAKLSGLLDNKPTSHFHSLRHGFASHAIQRGMAIHNLRTILGHTNISTTNVYLEMNPSQALKEYEDLF